MPQAPDAAGDERTCAECGGQVVDGGMGLPLLGPPRFGVRLGTTEVTTEVRASMCVGCGLVRLRGRDPERIRVAAEVAAGDRTSRRLPWPRRPNREA